jgi:hypothetical protein
MDRPDLPVALTGQCASDSSSLASGAGVAAPVIPRSCFTSVDLARGCASWKENDKHESSISDAEGTGARDVEQ